jgi:hypothetical protein
MRTCWDAQAVMLLRTLRIAKGGARAEVETQRMITEKVAALAEAQLAATAAALKGRKKTSRCEKSAGRLHDASSPQQAKAIEITRLRIKPTHGLGPTREAQLRRGLSQAAFSRVPHVSALERNEVHSPP